MTLMTITRAEHTTNPAASARGARLVIIATALLGPFASAAAGTGDAHVLTTSVARTQASLPALTTVIVEGSSVYQPPQLFARSTHGSRPAGVARSARASSRKALADLYLRDGYVKPEVTIDDSLAAQGILRARVFEAQVSGVVIEGDAAASATQLERIGSAARQGALRCAATTSRSALRDMRQFAGLAVSASTRRDPQDRNAFELVVRADFSPVDGVVRMNNRGTDQVGPAFLLGQVFANGMFGRGEKIGLIFAAATDHEEYLGGGLFFDTPLNSRGTRANALLFRSHSAPNEAPVNLDDEYTRERVTLRVTPPIASGFQPLADRERCLRSRRPAHRPRRRAHPRGPAAHRGDRAARFAGRRAPCSISANLQLRHGLDCVRCRAASRMTSPWTRGAPTFYA